MQYQIISNNNNENLCVEILEKLFGEDSEFSLVLIDGKVMRVNKTYRSGCFVPVADIKWLSVEDLNECFDLYISKPGSSTRMETSENMLHLTIHNDELVGIWFKVGINTGRSMGNSIAQFFEFSIGNVQTIDLLSRYEYDLKCMKPSTMRDAHYTFTYCGIDFTVVSIGLDANSIPFTYIQHTTRTSTDFYRVSLIKKINEDKLGNRLDQDGEIIQEDDE